MDEGDLRARFPEIPWAQPVEVHVAGGGSYFVCRYCIAFVGVKAVDLEGKRVPFAFETRPEALDHVDRAHHD